MADKKVDASKQVHVLVVHGVQASTDEKLKQDVWIKDLVTRSLNGRPFNFTTSLFAYENINNANPTAFTSCVNIISPSLTSQIPLWGVPTAVNMGLAKVASLVDDVLIAVDRQGATAQLIKEKLKSRLVELFDAGHPVYLVAHSLGTVYAYWALMDLLADARYFDPLSKRTWPVQGLITLGSPLTLKMFGARPFQPFPGNEFPNPLSWFNFYDLADPIITGNVFGILNYSFVGLERFLAQGFFIDDLKIDSGKAWLLAHTSYWKNEMIGLTLGNMLTQDVRAIT